MLRKIDLRQIVHDHYRTLRDNRTEGRWVDRLLFLGVPALVAGLSLLLRIRLGDTGALLGGVSILGGFLFALLIVQLQMAGETAQRAETEAGSGVRKRLLRRRVLLQEVSANVAYAALASVTCTVLLGVGQFTLPERKVSIFSPVSDAHQPAWFTFLAVFALVHLVLTLLMVLKRTYSVLSRELDHAAVDPSRD